MFFRILPVITFAVSILASPVWAKNALSAGNIDVPAPGPMEATPDQSAKAKKAQIPSTKRDFEKIIARSKLRLKTNPQDAHAYIDLGYAYGNLLKPKKDLEYCNKAIEIDPNIPVAYSERAQAYLMLDQVDKALKDLEKAISLDPNNSAFYKTRGWIYGRQGKYKESIKECTKSISIYDGYSPAFYCRGRAYLFLEEYDKAIADYTEAIRLYPNEDEDYYSERAFAYNIQGKYRKALTDLNTALKINPKDAASLIYRSVALSNLGDERAAISNLNEAIGIKPDLANAYAHRGRAYLSLGEFEKSMQDLTKAIELDPEEDQAYHYRGLWHLRKEEFKKAIQAFKKAISLEPKKNSCFQLLAQTYMKMSDYKNAIVWWDKVIEKEPKNEIAISSRAAAMQKLQSKPKVDVEKNQKITADLNKLSSSSKQARQPVKFTVEELKLAKELGYSLEAMKIVKQATGSTISKITMNRFAPWEPQQKRFDMKDPWTPKNIAKVKAIAKKFPELAPVLKEQIERLEKRQESTGDLMKKMIKEAKKKVGAEEYEYGMKLREFTPYIAYERDKAGLDGYSIAMVPPNKSPKEIYFELKKKTANIKLPKEYLPIDAMVLTLPAGFGNKNILKLQDQLKPLGYSFYGFDSRFFTKTFDTSDEAKRFAGENLQVIHQPERYYEKTFDPGKYDPGNKMGQSFNLWPGVDVEKVGATKWLMRHPEEFRVEGSFMRAVLVKDLKQFQYLRLVGSSGPNYSVTNKMVIEKLKKWDKLYGVRVLSASGDSVRFKLQKEPKDLSRFLTEVFLICPDTMELSSDMMLSASEMREQAERFRSNKFIGFWWD